MNPLVQAVIDLIEQLPVKESDPAKKATMQDAVNVVRGGIINEFIQASEVTPGAPVSEEDPAVVH